MLARAARRFGPTHAAEQQLRIGEIGVEIHIRRAFAEAGDRQRDRRRPLDQVVDLEAELLARLLVEIGRHPDRRLLIVRRVEDALPGKLGGHALDLNRALGLDRLLGEVHVDRTALDIHAADEIGGDCLVEPRHAAELDSLNYEVFPERHRQSEAARGGAAEKVGLQPDGLQIASGSSSSSPRTVGVAAGCLEGDDPLLRVRAEVGDVEAAVAERNLPPRRWHDDLSLRNIDGKLCALDGQFGVAGRAPAANRPYRRC